MEKLHWTVEEVISYVEYLISLEMADESEMEMYESYKWNNGKLDKNKYINTYKGILRKMKQEYDI